MTTTLTKNIKFANSYQQWNPGEWAEGDILGIYESLGNRAANKVVVESIGGESTIRLNVSENVYRQAGTMYEDWVGLGQGGNRPLPLLVAEVEVPRPDIHIESGATFSLSLGNIAIKDLKIVSAASGLRVIVF